MLCGVRPGVCRGVGDVFSDSTVALAVLRRGYSLTYIEPDSSCGFYVPSRANQADGPSRDSPSWSEVARHMFVYSRTLTTDARDPLGLEVSE
jgi:hypothetical protein